jgi:hypothetical protein
VGDEQTQSTQWLISSDQSTALSMGNFIEKLPIKAQSFQL